LRVDCCNNFMCGFASKFKFIVINLPLVTVKTFLETRMIICRNHHYLCG
jgi:hypothetical protein